MFNLNEDKFWFFSTTEEHSSSDVYNDIKGDGKIDIDTADRMLYNMSAHIGDCLQYVEHTKQQNNIDNIKKMEHLENDW